MARLRVTKATMEKAGDALLEALLVSVPVTGLFRPPGRAEVGDLVAEVSSSSLEWERVGYLLRVWNDGGEVWTVGGRVVQWSNASFVRLGGHPGARLRSLPYPTPEQIEESRKQANGEVKS